MQDRPHNGEPPAEADLVVLGSGVGGLTAALTAALQGLSAVIIEHSEWIGGTSARSSGTVWVPGNHHLNAHGITGDGEDAARYLASLVAERGDGGFTMVPHVLCTAVEYDIPVVWNNFAWAAIRDLQYAYFDGREYGTGFYQGANRRAYNPDFAVWAKAAGVAGHTVTRSQDFAGVLQEAVASGKPALIDVHVDADIRPPGTGAWELPPIPPKQPVFGAPWRPGSAA